ncbi:MAG: DUF763 domain-containing protein [Candidatus Micrarchaeota archaeon]|nr:DUF763 domain-containing protein [Candidatus Micrarchaeota archaeon]
MRSITELPLHGGRAPKWLFGRMVKLSRAISCVIMDDFGAEEMVRRIADPNWFQALSCAIGYDWHSSGTTTVTMGALKEAVNDSGELYIAGGKGRAGLKTPDDILQGADCLSMPGMAVELQEKSRIAAKVDSSLVYDDIGIYHHTMAFCRSGKWAVVQQGMSKKSNMAVRFQWLSEFVDDKDVANEPHSSVSSVRHRSSMDLTSKSNDWVRGSSTEALGEYNRMLSKSYPQRHGIIAKIDMSKRARDAIARANDIDPKDYKEIMLVRGVGRATLRSLAFVSSLIYGREIAYRDPVMYAYNLGGKDGIPFRINRGTYDGVCRSLQEIIENSKIENGEKYKALKRLSREISP